MPMVLLLVVLSIAHPPTEGENGWIPLFNGLNLDGWRANVEPGSFTVQDGVLTAHCTSESVRSHLFFVGNSKEGFESFKNFELKALVRGESNSNSGIFFHTDLSTRDERLHLANGYEVQLNSSVKEGRKTGSLYSIVDLDQAVTDDTQWFEVHLLVQGKRIVVNIDGKAVVDYVEADKPERPPNRKGRVLKANGGAIALQAHDPDSIWYFKGIMIKKLPE